MQYTHQLTESKMTGKLKGIPALNTNTLSNTYCSKMRNTDTICKVCYSASMLEGARKNCAPAWEKNSNALTSLIPIDNLPSINAHTFRFHAHGELINYAHLENFINIAIKNPDTHFALWTKRTNLVKQFLKVDNAPKNIIFIYSNPKTNTIIEKPPTGFHKVFNASYDDTVKEGQTHCTGQKCVDCMACYRHNESTVIIEKVKYR
jgi:hypothetical protein|tara:strand:+ start:436 stop:1050 length:615 start_codon:yes stop_codon:yes gene_type:complete